MANEEHLAMLKQGVEIWNQWRSDNTKIRPDLTEADLSDVNFSKADLSDANLRDANLSCLDLSGAVLSGAVLGGAVLSRAILSGAFLIGADLVGAKLIGTDFTAADLSGADFSAANLNRADFTRAILHGTNFSRAVLSRAVLKTARIGWTVFGNNDLSEVIDMEAVVHEGPSTIGIDTITRSQGNIPEIFLRGAGVPDNFITYMKSLAGAAFDFYSCFISHSSPDKAFVERLYADLQAKGVRCWYAPEDLKIGEPFLLGIDKGIRLHDKLLLVLSEHSVASGWVQHEVLAAMAKERGKAPWVLFPIRVDDTVMNTGVSWATMIKQSRHIGDFTCWKDHDAYQKAFERLLRDLKAGG